MKQREMTNDSAERQDQTVADYFETYDFGDSSLIIVPGTNDRDGATITEWADFIVRRFHDEQRTIVDYPATAWPLVGGRRALRYDESKRIARERTQEKLEERTRATGRAVLLGYSQGADAAWEAAVESVESGAIDPADLQVILWGHPQYPDGLKDGMSHRHKITSRLFKTAFQAEMNGAWQVHPDIPVTSIAIGGDPITSFSRVWPHPVRFASSFAAGYFMIHSGIGHESAAQLEKLSVTRTETIPGTATTYLDVAAADPREQARTYARRRLQSRQLRLA